MTPEQHKLIEQWAADTETQAGQLFAVLLAAYDAQSRCIAELEATIKQSDADAVQIDADTTQEYLAADVRIAELQRALEEAKRHIEEAGRTALEQHGKLTTARARAEAAEKVLRQIANMFGNEDRSNRECCEPAFRYFNPAQPSEGSK